MDCLLSTSCDSKQVVVRLTESLQLDPASLKQPDPETKKWIRCLAGKAKRSERPDVFDHLREITPAGTTGECVLGFHVIPIYMIRGGGGGGGGGGSSS